MGENRTIDRTSLLADGIRPSSAKPLIVYLCLWAAFGVVSFVLIGRSERQYNLKMAMIQSGAVQPQTFYVTRINSHHRHGWGIHMSRRPGPWRSGDEDVYQQATLLDGLSIGSHVSAYRIDGKWFVPRFYNGFSFTRLKWAFLCFGLGLPLLVAAIAVAVRVASKRVAMPPQRP